MFGAPAGVAAQIGLGTALPLDAHQGVQPEPLAEPTALPASPAELPVDWLLAEPMSATAGPPALAPQVALAAVAAPSTGDAARRVARRAEAAGEAMPQGGLPGEVARMQAEGMLPGHTVVQHFGSDWVASSWFPSGAA